MKFARWTFVGLILLGLVAIMQLIALETHREVHLFEAPPSGKSITFLLGKDKPGQHYFQLAESHFLWDTVEKSDQVVKSVLTLSGVIDYLNTNISSNTPWDVVNIVVHGNMWSGLSVPMWDEGERAFPKELYRAAKSGQFPAIANMTVNEHTRINIWACGIGRNPLIKLALSSIFTTPSGITPQIYASPDFVIFKEDSHGQVRRLRADYWPYFFRRGYRPSDSEIALALSRQFPEDTIDWRGALVREESDEKVSFTEQFHVPVSWTVLYQDKSSRPEVGTQEQQMDWIKSQPELMQKIADLDIPLDKYKWTVNKIIYKHPDGHEQPAIKAIGMSTVLCVLHPIEI